MSEKLTTSVNSEKRPIQASVGCSTDLRNSDFVGLDLLTSLEESPQKFQLRATDDSDLQDSLGRWIQPMSSFSDESVQALSPDQIGKTLDYFLLCSERVSQMTKTYNDVDAVTQLLEEKEKDLELAAKIGQSLLEQNRELQRRNEFLEEQFTATNDHVTQLRHELCQKVDLLHIYADSESETTGQSSSQQDDDPVTNGSILKRVKLLEDENSGLKLEATHLRCLTQGLEEKEQQLVHDCVKQLEEANKRVKLLHSELAEKSEECSLHQGEVSKLLKELVEAQKKERKIAFDNDDLTMQLHAAQETQAELAQEVLDLQERYAEVMAMLDEAQEELSHYRKSAIWPGRGGSPLADSMYDSLQSELEASDSGFYSTPLLSARSADERLKKSDAHIQRTMRTVKEALERASLCEDDEEDSCHHPSEAIPEDPDVFSPSDAANLVPAERDRCRTPSPSKFRGPIEELNISREESPISTISSFSSERKKQFSPKSQLSPKSGVYSGGKLSHAPSTDSLASYAGPALGEPGMPGTRDLEFAIRRLSMRRKVELDYQKFRQSKGYASQPVAPSTPGQLNVPATHSNRVSKPSALNTATTTRNSPMGRPQLYKPLEGSQTLKQWRMLATPSLFGAINSVHTLPGIRMRASFYQHLRSSTPMRVDRDATPTKDSGFATELDDSGLDSTSSSAESSTANMRTPGTFSFVNSEIPYPESSTATTSPTSQRLKSISRVTACQATPPNRRVRTYSGNNATSVVWSSNAKSVMTTQPDTKVPVGLGVVASPSVGASCDRQNSGILTRAELKNGVSRGAEEIAQSFTVSDYVSTG